MRWPLIGRTERIAAIACGARSAANECVSNSDVEGSGGMTDESATASAVGSPVVAAVRSQVPEFEEAFQAELDAEGPEMGAFQAMSVFATWLRERIDQSSEGPDVHRAFRVVEEIASNESGYPMGRALVTEFVEALTDHARAVPLKGPETLRRN
jgi:hypothetical protein